MIDQIKDKISKLSTKADISESEVDHLMSLIRKLQERIHCNPRNYALLNFYVDWTKHAVIDRNPASKEIITKLNEILYKFSLVKSLAPIRNEITNLLSFEYLREEFRRFLSENDISTLMATDKNSWNRFSINLINIISDCPLTIPSNFYSKIPRSLRDGAIATQASLSWVNNTEFPKTSYVPNPKLRINPSTKILSLVINMSDGEVLKLMFPIYDNLYLTSE